MNLINTIQEIHQNAINHGWWETDHSTSESIVLIHSEWSEAVEEARAGRPMVWHEEYRDSEGKTVRTLPKPEGIAVELADGVIRIFDLFGKHGYRPSRQTAEELIRASRAANPYITKETPLVDIVSAAHSLTARAGDMMLVYGPTEKACLAPLEACAGLVMCWLKLQGEDPVAVIKEKHQYNITRPYKHGKAF